LVIIFSFSKPQRYWHNCSLELCC